MAEMDEMLADMRSLIAQQVAAGFASNDEIIEGVKECMEDEYDRTDLDPDVERIARELIEEHRRAESLWTLPTDCDRIDRAFADLEEQGIVARQNFTCCQQCGHGEIREEIQEAQRRRPITGYVFYHRQNTEFVLDDGNLCLAFGSVVKDDEAALTVARTIVQSLQQAGLKVEWDGSLEKVIVLPEVDWKRRRLFS